MQQGRRVVGTVVLVAVALSMTACFNVQCGVGRDIAQVNVPDPMVGAGVFFGCAAVFLLAVAALFSGRGDGSGGLGSGGG